MRSNKLRSHQKISHNSSSLSAVRRKEKKKKKKISQDESRCSMISGTSRYPENDSGTGREGKTVDYYSKRDKRQPRSRAGCTNVG